MGDRSEGGHSRKELPQRFGIAIDERVVEYPWIFGHLLERQNTGARMLDAGSILNHDFILRRIPFQRE